MNLQEKCLAKVDKAEGLLWQDEIAKVSDPIIQALRVAIEAHGEIGRRLDIDGKLIESYCSGCEGEYTFAVFPCVFLRPIAEALEVDDE